MLLEDAKNLRGGAKNSQLRANASKEMPDRGHLHPMRGNGSAAYAPVAAPSPREGSSASHAGQDKPLKKPVQLVPHGDAPTQ